MRYRTLGRTGLAVSEIGFGCGNNGGIIFRPPPQTRLMAVQHALELGINYFDTAPQYGQGQSEENLGQILKELQSQPYVTTKIRLKDEDLSNLSQAISNSLAVSLKKLQRDYVDVLLLHNPVCLQRGARRDAISLEDFIGVGGVLDTMEKLRIQGKVRFLGFTGLGDTEALHTLVKTGRFDVVQCYYNILNPSAAIKVPTSFSAQDYQELIGAAVSAGMGILGMRILAAGALSTTPPENISERPLSPGSEFSTDSKRRQALQSLLGQEANSFPELALRYGLANKQISCILIGFAQLEHIAQAAAWANAGPLSRPILEKIYQIQMQDFHTT